MMKWDTWRSESFTEQLQMPLAGADTLSTDDQTPQHSRLAYYHILEDTLITLQALVSRQKQTILKKCNPLRKYR